MTILSHLDVTIDRYGGQDPVRASLIRNEFGIVVIQLRGGGFDLSITTTREGAIALGEAAIGVADCCELGFHVYGSDAECKACAEKRALHRDAAE